MQYKENHTYWIEMPYTTKYDDHIRSKIIYVKKVHNPDNLQLNTLHSDFPCLKYFLNDDVDIEKWMLIKIEHKDDPKLTFVKD